MLIETDFHPIPQACTGFPLQKNMPAFGFHPKKEEAEKRKKARATTNALGTQTKRIEDRAYGLMGLFDISMPMLYGERDKAFLRLQQHIIQKTKDESIFAWPMELLPEPSSNVSGLYAPSPLVFIDCDHMISVAGSRGFFETSGDLHLRGGICDQSQLAPKKPLAPSEMKYAVLHCAREASPDSRICIALVRIVEILVGWSMCV